MPSASVDFCAGAVAGMTSKLFDHPFDTVKVNLQRGSGACGTSTKQCVQTLFQGEGVRGFYKGVMAPLGLATASNMVLFTVFNRTHNYAIDNGWQHGTATLLAGSSAGVVVAHIQTPVELLKCRVQATDKSVYSGVVDCLRKTVRKDGPRALFGGHAATLSREVPGNTIWYGCYELCVSAVTPINGTKKDVAPWKLACSGGLAGSAYWTAMLPVDAVKTRLQTSPYWAAQGMRATARALFVDEGLRAAYRGLGITLIRAFPANAIIFGAYEAVTRLLTAAPILVGAAPTSTVELI